MTRIYEIRETVLTPDGDGNLVPVTTRKIYRRLDNLCNANNLSYTKVYHKVGRKGEEWISDDRMTAVERVNVEDPT